LFCNDYQQKSSDMKSHIKEMKKNTNIECMASCKKQNRMYGFTFFMLH
jgi:hypothetical protein